MGQKLPLDQLALYKRIDEILWKDWDPIGISDMPQARDEYYGYLPHVFSLALDNQPAEKIAEYLHWVASERMGLAESTVAAHLAIAEKILAARPGA